jgi:hypothetical protein
MARKHKISLPEFIRQKVLQDSEGGKRRRFTRCRETGARIFAGLPGSAPLTTESVREMSEEQGKAWQDALGAY